MNVETGSAEAGVFVGWMSARPKTRTQEQTDSHLDTGQPPLAGRANWMVARCKNQNAPNRGTSVGRQELVTVYIITGYLLRDCFPSEVSGQILGEAQDRIALLLAGAV